MRTVVGLAFVLALVGCGDPAPTADVCDAAVLANKVERFGETAATLTDEMSVSSAATIRQQFAAYADRITAKSGELSRSAAAMPTDAARTERLCRGYDELQAIVDETAKARSQSPSASNAQDAPG